MKLKNYGEGIAKGMAVTMKNALRTTYHHSISGTEIKYLPPHPGESTCLG